MYWAAKSMDMYPKIRATMPLKTPIVNKMNANIFILRFFYSFKKNMVVRTDNATSELNSFIPDFAITAVKPAKHMDMRA